MMSRIGTEPLLNMKSYDEDTDLFQSGSEEEDEFDNTGTYDGMRVPNHKDRQVLQEAGEEQNLLRKPERFDKVGQALRSKENVSRRRVQNDQKARRLRQDAEGSGNAELIYEMEGGFKDNSSRSSVESLALAEEKWNQEPRSGKPFVRLLFITLGIAMLFMLLSYGSYRASNHAKTSLEFSNGTHTFGPTTILISLDGFRADFFQRGLTPAMKALIESGVSPRYMSPSFPSLTFPNHFTLVTGLYPESHGIVGNQFWDPLFQEEFYYTNTSSSMQPKWWNAEPIWVTAEKAGLKTAIHMWPGSEAHIDATDPTYLDKFNESEALDIKVGRILQWLDMPREGRPQLIGAYVPNVDSDGHRYGPNSTEIRATIAEVDNMLTNLVEGLFQRNLTEIVNLVVVSDHGMATTSNNRLIQLDDFIDMSLVDHIDGWPLRGLRLKNPDRDVSVLYQQLLAASEDSSFEVYTIETMPERYHFSKNDRIAPLWVIPKAGWAVVEKVDFDIIEAQATGKQYHPLGLHGYDHEHPLMRAIFVARGPAFPHFPNSRIATFQNIEVYNIVCDSLGITPHPNNGTLRLPFTTEGLHSDFEENIQVPADPVISALSDPLRPTKIDASRTGIVSNTGLGTSTVGTSSATSTVKQDITAVDNSGQDSKTTTKVHSSWWDFLHNKLDKAKEWAKELIDSIRNNKASKDPKTP